ncbi:MAG TPA: hypothetical protein PLV25_02460, partial [Opitutales bacterium]|nr:hypothetical protein [Opitutales bacterium]
VNGVLGLQEAPDQSARRRAGWLERIQNFLSSRIGAVAFGDYCQCGAVTEPPAGLWVPGVFVEAERLHVQQGLGIRQLVDGPAVMARMIEILDEYTWCMQQRSPTTAEFMQRSFDALLVQAGADEATYERGLADFVNAMHEELGEAPAHYTRPHLRAEEALSERERLLRVFFSYLINPDYAIDGQFEALAIQTLNYLIRDLTRISALRWELSRSCSPNGC